MGHGNGQVAAQSASRVVPINRTGKFQRGPLRSALGLDDCLTGTMLGDIHYLAAQIGEERAIVAARIDEVARMLADLTARVDAVARSQQ